METELILTEVADYQSNTNKHTQEIVDYYEIAGPDYREWSKNFNMHFGFYKWGMNPFRLEPMLNQMNEEVYKRLQIIDNQSLIGLDMGCGLGTTGRFFARKNPKLKITGLTIVPWQIQEGNQLTQQLHLQKQFNIVKADYTNTHFVSESFDFAYALESSCYAQGKGKADLIAEMSRLLVAGGRFVIADGFLKQTKPLPKWLQGIYRGVCKAWAIADFGGINEFKQNLENQGFTDIKIEEASWNVAPSVAYIPKTTIKFLLKEIWRTGRLHLAPERRNNVIAPILGMFLGLARPYFGYYLVSGRKK